MTYRNDRNIDHEPSSRYNKFLHIVAALWLFFFVLHVHALSFADQAMLARLRNSYGDEAHERGVLLNQLLTKIQASPESKKLHEVNRFFNQFMYTEDIQQWGQRDYWATPEEFIGTHQGDCEDYVIAKYFALRALGVSEKKLYLTYVRATELNVSHMVLTYFNAPTSIPLVLDNYDHRILPATQRRDLLPVYSFNVKDLFLANPSASLGKKLPTGKIKNSKWTSLLNSLQEEAP